MSISVTYNDWKSRLAQILIEKGMKKKLAKKYANEYDEEFNMGFPPKSIADAIIWDESNPVKKS